jgi:hypothetical protein
VLARTGHVGTIGAARHFGGWAPTFAVGALVADTERIAVVLTALTVYPTGLVLRLELHVRKDA